MAHRTTAPSATDLAFTPGLSLATRSVLIGLLAEPELTTAALARALDVDRRTIRRALAEADAAGVIRLGPGTATERGPIEWRQVPTWVSPGGARLTTPPPEEVNPAPPGGQSRPSSTPQPGAAASLFEDEGQRQGRTPPTPPSITPLDEEPASVTTERELREAVTKVRRLRREGGLLTGTAYDRDVQRVLVQVLGLAHRDGLTVTLDDVAEAAGESLALTPSAVIVTLNKGRAAPRSLADRPLVRLRAHGPSAAEQADPNRVWD